MYAFGKERHKAIHAQGMLGPGADAAFTALTSPEIRQRVRIAHLTHRWRDALQQSVGLPLGRFALQRWAEHRTESRYIEAFGLSRHALEEELGSTALTLHVDLRKLIRIAVHAPRHLEKRPSSLAFIWDGSWDLRREDLRVGTRYRLISELDENRDHLERTERYKDLMDCIERGEPWASHQQGVLLDTPEKILDYLRVYLHFLDDMAANGYDPARGKDPIGVAISREGRILKINRGLHRLAMAQRIGLPSIPVRVRCVHRIWWDRVTRGASGVAAMEQVREALQQCVPEEAPGPLDEDPPPILPDDFWPPVRFRDARPRCSH